MNWSSVRTLPIIMGMGAVTYSAFETPLGTMVAAADDRALVALEFVGASGVSAILNRLDEPPQQLQTAFLTRVRSQLHEYFEGSRRTFDIPLAPRGTPFQHQVWTALRRVQFGSTRSYSDIAREVGRDKAVRAVAAANGANPIAILVPCHRIIGSDGSLTGYAAGLWRKQALLELEGVLERSDANLLFKSRLSTPSLHAKA